MTTQAKDLQTGGEHEVLRRLNDQFIEAWRQGSWDLIKPVLAASFTYIDGLTGHTRGLAEYAAELQSSAQPSLRIDQTVIHVSGATAFVSARTNASPGQYRRYVDVYQRNARGWVCVSACVWPLPTAAAAAPADLEEEE